MFSSFYFLSYAIQAKEKVENTIKKAHDELKESRAQQAEARYLLMTYFLLLVYL